MSASTTIAIPVGTYGYDATHSKIGFAVRHMGVSTFRSYFEDVDASLVAAGDGTLSLAGTVRVESLAIKDENLLGHLYAEDFFDARNHPELSFASKAIEVDGDRVAVDGELTIKGITQPIHGEGTITEPTEDPFGGTRIGLELSAEVDRTAHGMTWQAPLPKGGDALGEKVRLVVELELVRQEG